MGKKKISQFPSATPVSGDKFLIEKSDGTYKNVDFDDLATASITGKEDTSNKSSSYTASSTTTYANTKALVDGLATKPDKAASNIFMYRNFK